MPRGEVSESRSTSARLSLASETAPTFAFAAGAMLALVALEVAPSALARSPGLALLGATVGGALMLALTFLLGI